VIVCGLECDDLPESYIPLEAAVVFKCLDADGKVGLVTRATDGLSLWDEVGLFTAGLDAARADCVRCFGDDDE
jgi:hypothetical protein